MSWITRWLAAAGALLAALGAAVLYGRAKGKAAEQGKTRDAQETATAAQATVHAGEGGRMNQRPEGYLSKWQDLAVGAVVGVLFVALMAAFVAYLASIA